MRLSKKEHEELRAIAAEWKGLRVANLLTQAQLGALIGISKRQVQNIEWALSRPSYSTASKFRAFKAKHDRATA